VVQRGRSECLQVAEGGSRGNRKQAMCCVVLKTKMSVEEQNVECVDWLFSIFYYSNSNVLL